MRFFSFHYVLSDFIKKKKNTSKMCEVIWKFNKIEQNKKSKKKGRRKIFQKKKGICVK